MQAFLLPILSPILVLSVLVVLFLPKSCVNDIQKKARDAADRNSKIMKFREQCETDKNAGNLELIVDGEKYKCPE